MLLGQRTQTLSLHITHLLFQEVGELDHQKTDQTYPFLRVFDTYSLSDLQFYRYSSALVIGHSLTEAIFLLDQSVTDLC